MDTMPKLEARVRLYDDPRGGPTQLLAFAELTSADAFVINGIRVLAKREGHAGDRAPFVVWPAERGIGRDMDRWYDLAHPIHHAAREAALRSILAAYEKAMKQQGRNVENRT